MSENNAWEAPKNPEPQASNSKDVITAKATSKKSDGDKKAYVGAIETGAIGVTASAPKKKTAVKKTAKKSTDPTTAIYSSKNVVWEGVGKVEKGYNIVTEKAAEKWLTRSHVRLATPEEVAREYGA